MPPRSHRMGSGIHAWRSCPEALADGLPAATFHVVWGEVERDASESPVTNNAVMLPESPLSPPSAEVSFVSSFDSLPEGCAMDSDAPAAPNSPQHEVSGDEAASSTALEDAAAPVCAPERLGFMREALRAALAGHEGLWSAGSGRHVDGNCKACHYIHSAAGCAGDLNCDFCHLPHTGLERCRVSATKRSHCKRVANALQAHCGSDKDLLKELGAVAARRSKYMQCILQEGLR
mmetsp:Transcript_127873/g.370064  ORF Transcript_127873/g.370064 Transcript_127873/m.370064 type:complete len:233 (+) Transcript_127873:107-805(+)